MTDQNTVELQFGYQSSKKFEQFAPAKYPTKSSM